MKKKIKDFTIGEVAKICKNCPNCKDCPFYKAEVGCIEVVYDNDLEKEIEVEEDKPQKYKDLRGCC